ncbi:MAG: transcription antitermination factor NusB [Chlamydiae bacterium]|nr:transcription antitermination factor NusB [Chlamydiota bacterium]
MAISRQKFRELVFQLLFSDDFAKSDERDLLYFFMRQFFIPRKTVLEARKTVLEIEKGRDGIDKLISEMSTEYALERIPKVERNILRLGIYELMQGKIPPKVAITEAMRLSRKYASPESASFINAILDKIYHACKFREEQAAT